MNDEFLNNLKREFEQNPTWVMAGIGGLLAGAAKLIEAVAHHKGATAFAKGEARRQKAAKMK